jgi:hypothetical protein
MAAFPEPNYVNPQTRVAAVIGLVVVGLVIMTPFVVSRLYARYIRRVFWVDDWIIVAAAVRPALANTILKTLIPLSRSPVLSPRY